MAERLSQLDPRPVSLALDTQVMDKLDDICERKRIVRDAFFNRLFLLLAASPQLIDRLFFLTVAKDWKDELWKAYKTEWPKFFESAFYPLEQEIDHFWAIREALEMYSRDIGLRDHTVPETGAVVQVHEEFAGSVRPRPAFFLAVVCAVELAGGAVLRVADRRQASRSAVGVAHAQQHLLDAVALGHRLPLGAQVVEPRQVEGHRRHCRQGQGGQRGTLQ